MFTIKRFINFYIIFLIEITPSKRNEPIARKSQQTGRFVQGPAGGKEEVHTPGCCG